MPRKRNQSHEEEEVPQQPQKKYYRSRAHCNPLSHNNGFTYPLRPGTMDWTQYYPQYIDKDRKMSAEVTVLDIGCGFGGLTVALAALLPDRLVLGMEIRAKVCEFVRLRIEATRHEQPGSLQNASCLRTNCMRYLPNFFTKSQLEKIFICFPDPHFKQKNHRRRIISAAMLTEYAYLLRPGGRLYVVTDVAELHSWHVSKCDAHRSFRRVCDEEALESDSCVEAMLAVTEEGQKVARNGGEKHWAVYRRIGDDDEARHAEIMTLFASE